MNVDEQQLWTQVFHATHSVKGCVFISSRDADDAVTAFRRANGQPDYRAAIKRAIRVLGPEAPACSGCQAEWAAALEILKDAAGE